MMPMQAAGLCVRRRGKRLIGPVDLTLSETGFTVVLGPNGSGKTTLLKALHGIERLSDGHVNWAMPTDQAQKAQAYVFQTPIMLRRSVLGNLEYPLALDGVARAERLSRAEDWAARIGLADAITRPATRLSGGEKQKLALARALIRKPQVLFLDEPCSNLDGRSTREIETLLQAANDAGTRIIMATHDLGQARRLASEIVFVLSGKIHEHGQSAAAMDAPQTPEFQAFLRGDIVE